MDPETRQTHVLVAEDQLSLAIGKEGQNVRLAARLTGWKIDIKDGAKYDYEAEHRKMEALKAAAEEDALDQDYEDDPAEEAVEALRVTKDNGSVFEEAQEEEEDALA